MEVTLAKSYQFIVNTAKTLVSNITCLFPKIILCLFIDIR